MHMGELEFTPMANLLSSFESSELSEYSRYISRIRFWYYHHTKSKHTKENNYIHENAPSTCNSSSLSRRGSTISFHNVPHLSPHDHRHNPRRRVNSFFNSAASACNSRCSCANWSSLFSRSACVCLLFSCFWWKRYTQEVTSSRCWE